MPTPTASASKSAQREQQRQQTLTPWAEQHQLDLKSLDAGQQWVLFAALQLVAVVGSCAPLTRVVGYLLAHCGMALPGRLIAAVVGVSDRALRTTKALSPKDLL